MVVLRIVVWVAALAGATGALAHVSVQPQEAVAGGYQVLRFGVGHGCDGRPTISVRIEIPDGVSAARPQPKPGWRLTVRRSAEGVTTAVTWTGRLSADEFDEFLILTRLPSEAGPLAFPAIQACEGGEMRWTEIAPPGEPRPSRPAPVVTLKTGAAVPGHDRHH